MEKITFERLQELVANIDYIWDHSFPVSFCVINNGKKVKFECGITNSFHFEGDFYDEYQYVFMETVLPSGRKYSNFVDLQNPDDMIYEEIREMLKNKCDISDESAIYLYKNSFSGKRRNVTEPERLPFVFKTDARIAKYELELTDEVCKGIEWFKKITGEDKILISTEPGKFVDLNGMNGRDFAFLFDGRKVLYYDMFTNAICTYCPTDSIRHRNYKSYKRIESNDKFNWILLSICTGDDLLSSTKVCFVNVQDEYGKVIYYEDVNIEKINKFFQEIYLKAMEMSSE
jgi:hypothetical protein